LEIDLTADANESAFPVNEEDEEGIKNAINMSDSMLAAEICVTSRGTHTALGNLMSPSISIASNSHIQTLSHNAC